MNRFFFFFGFLCFYATTIEWNMIHHSLLHNTIQQTLEEINNCLLGKTTEIHKWVLLVVHYGLFKKKNYHLQTVKFIGTHLFVRDKSAMITETFYGKLTNENQA